MYTVAKLRTGSPQPATLVDLPISCCSVMAIPQVLPCGCVVHKWVCFSESETPLIEYIWTGQLGVYSVRRNELQSSMRLQI